MKRSSLRWCTGFKLLFFICLLSFVSISFALPFSIAPKAGTQLPTSINQGSTAPAFYTVTNNTGSTRNNNYVKYLPPNVSIASGGCGSNFNLAPHGYSGDSCTLNLIVSGAVNGNDPDPHHRLFVCFPGGTTCAGTNYPLNVSINSINSPRSIVVTPANPNIFVGGTEQFIATGSYSNGSTQDLTSSVIWASSDTSKATITSDGLATGVGMGSSTITAVFGPVTGSTTLTILKQVAYVANNSGGTSISICPVIQGGGSLGLCNSYSDPTFNSPIDVVLNTTSTFAYIANASSNTISVCPVNPDGSLNPCQAVPVPGSTLFTGLRINSANTLLYYTDLTNNIVSICQVNANGSLGTCTQQSSAFFDGPTGRIALNATGNLAYIADGNSFTNFAITICAINPDGSFGICNAVSDPTFLFTMGAEIDPTNTYLYVPNFNSGIATISICPINPDGTLGPCTANTGNNTFNFLDDNAINMFIQNINGVSYAYTPNGGSSSPATVSICPLQPDGSFGTCNAHPDATFHTPDGIWIATFGQHL